MQYLTLGYLTISDARPREIVEAAAAAGFDSVGLRVVGRNKNDNFPDLVGNPVATAEVRKSLADAGVRLASVTGNYLASNAKADDMRALAEIGAELGADYVAISGYDQDHRRLAESIAYLAEQSMKVGLRVAFEFVPYSAVTNLEQAWSVLKMANHPAAGLRIDALHHVRSGGTAAQLSAIDPAYMFYFQICDGPIANPSALDALKNESRAGRYYPGEGEFPLYDLLDALPVGIEIEAETPHPLHQQETATQRATRALISIKEFMLKYAAHCSRGDKHKPG